MKLLDYLKEKNFDYAVDNDGKIIVYNCLDLENTTITKLPNDLLVCGYLSLIDSNITELPDNLSVDGDLYLSNSKITKLPSDLSVGENLDLRNSEITKLPEGLSVGGDLRFGGSNTAELLKNLSVDGYLNINDNQINELLFRMDRFEGGSLHLDLKKLKKHNLDNNREKLKDFLNKISQKIRHKETTNTLPPSRTLLFSIATELFEAEKKYRLNLPAAEVNIANAIIRLLEVANFLEIEIEIDITGTYSESITLGYKNPYDMFFCLIPCVFDLEAFIDHIKRRRKKSTLNKLRNVGPAFGGIIYELFKLGQVLNLDVKTAILEISNLPHSSK